MKDQAAEIVRSIQIRLKDAGFDPNESVVISASTDTDAPLVRAFFSAVVGLVGDPVLIMHTAGEQFAGVSDVTVEAASSADAVIDLSVKSWAYHESHDRFLTQLWEHGGRLLPGMSMGLKEDVDHLIRLVPSDDVKERTRRAFPLIDQAETIRLTSELGTDLLIERGDPQKLVAYAPDGQVAFAPPEDGVNGVLYYQGGVRFQAPYIMRQMVYKPIKIEIENGKIVSIARDTAMGIMLDDWFRSHNDPNSYQFAHVNLGLDPRIHLEDLDNIAVHFNYGATLIAFGINYSPIFGSEVRAQSHIDMNYVGGDYWADDLCLSRGGEFTKESGLRGPFGTMNSIKKEGE